MLCPRDPFNGYSYSAAGCPSVAMGQIINYLRTTQDTRFDDGDDYHHNYVGRVYDIDEYLTLATLLDSTDGTLSVADFEKGIYLLQIKGENFLETTKFIVK